MNRRKDIRRPRPDLKLNVEPLETRWLLSAGARRPRPDQAAAPLARTLESLLESHSDADSFARDLARHPRMAGDLGLGALSKALRRHAGYVDRHGWGAALVHELETHPHYAEAHHLNTLMVPTSPATSGVATAGPISAPVGAPLLVNQPGNPPSPTPSPTPPPVVQDPLGVAVGGYLDVTLPDLGLGSVGLTDTITPQPLPANMTFNRSTGELVFAPAPGQAGTYDFTVAVRAASGTGTIVLPVTVTSPVVPSTEISGRVVGEDGKPLAGMPVTVDGSSAVTDSSGGFALTGVSTSPGPLGAGGAVATGQSRQPLLAPVSQLLGHAVYAGADNVLPAPLIVPSLDWSPAASVGPAPADEPVDITTPALPGFDVRLPADPGATTTVAGTVSVASLPAAVAYQHMPPGIGGDMLVVSVAGIALSQPAVLTLPNSGNLKPGSVENLYLMNMQTGGHDLVGQMLVSDDGATMTSEGTVTLGSSNVAPAAGVSGGFGPNTPTPPPTIACIVEGPASSNNTPVSECANCQNKLASTLSPASTPQGQMRLATASDGGLITGEYFQDHQLVTHQSQGQSLGIDLQYSSLQADPHPVVQYQFTTPIAGDSSSITSITAQVSLAGVVQGSATTYSVSGLADGDTYNIPLQVDASSLATGVYSYTMTVTETFGTGSPSTVTTTNDGTVDVINGASDALGAGWSIGGLQHLAQLGSGDPVLITAGQQGNQQFDPVYSDGQTYVQDLALASSTSAAEILANDGTGGFSAASLTAGSVAGSVAGDFNGDGKPDLAVVGSSTLAILLNNGSGGFTAGSTYSLSAPASGVVAGNFTGHTDGTLDLAVLVTSGGMGSSSVEIFPGNGDGTFGTPVTTGVGGSGGSENRTITAGDFNGDGKTDLAISTFDGQLVIALATTGGSLTTSTVTMPSGHHAFGVVTADVNGDGKTDLIVDAANDNVSDSAGDFAALDLFEGNGSGGFTYTSTFQTVGHDDIDVQGLVAGDFQGSSVGLEVAVPVDGSSSPDSQFVDVVPLSSSGTWGQGDLISMNNAASSSGSGDIVAADLNGVGKPSIALTNGTGVIDVLLADPDSNQFFPLQVLSASGSGTLTGFIAVAPFTGDAATPGYRGPASDPSTLVQNTGGTWTRTYPDGTVFQFNSSGQETSMADRNGNTSRCAYVSGGAAAGALSTITDPVGQVTVLNYDSSGQLSGVVDPAQAVVPAVAPTPGDAGFESPSVGSGNFQYDPTGTAWSYSGSSGVSANGSGFTVSNPSAPEGSQVGILQGTGAFGQSISGWSAGTYVIGFDAAQRGSSQASQQDFEVLVDGGVVGTFTPSGTSYQPYATATFTVSAGAHTITFQGLDSAGGDNTAFVDAVAVDVAAPAVGDGGFEQPSTGSYIYDPIGTAWTFSGVAGNGSGVTTNGSGFTSGNPNAPEGSQVAFLQGDCTIGQSISGWAAGGYTISFQAAQRGNNGGSHQDFEVLVDGAIVGTFTPSGTSYATDTTATFSVAAGDHTITFLGLDSAGGDNTAFIDAVQVSLASLSAPAAGDAGFESPALGAGNFQYAPTGTAWSFSGGGISANGSGFTSGNPNAPEGSQVGFLQGTGSFSQSVSSWSAGSYVIRFDAAQRGNNGGSHQDFEVLVDGVVVGTFAPAGASYQLYTTGLFTVAAGSHTITFQGLDSVGGDNTAFVDAVTIAPGSGRATDFRLDSSGNLTEIVDPDGAVTAYGYSTPSDHLITTETDPNGHTATATYNGFGQLTGETLFDGTSTTSLSGAQGQGLLAPGGSGALPMTHQGSATDPDGHTTTLTFNWMGHPTGQVDGTGAPPTTITYDRHGFPTTVTDPMGRVTTYQYDQNGHVTKIIRPDGTSETIVYNDNFGVPTSITDFKAQTTTYTLDSHGNVLTRTDPDGLYESYTYNSAGQVLTDTDRNGNTTTYAYDSDGRLTTITAPNAGSGAPTVVLTYDGAGNVATATDALGNVTTYSYDNANRPTATQNPIQAAAGEQVTYRYDADGNLTSVTDANGHTTSYVYDARDELIAVVDPVNQGTGHATSYAHDASGNVTQVTDPLGHATTYSYDQDNRETGMTDAVGDRTTYTLDADGEVTNVIDPNGNTTTYSYNSLGLLQSQTLPGTAPNGSGSNVPVTTTYTYDPDNNLTRVTDALNHSVTYSYDSLNRKTGTTDGMGDRTTYTYDGNGNLKTVVDGNGHTTSYTYDSRNNELTKTDPAGGGTTTYTYDLANRLTSLTDPSNNTTTYQYDSANRVTTVTDPLGHTTYTYDLMNNVTGKTDADGRIYQYGYDADDRETTETWIPVGGGSALNTITYTYDAAGRLTQVQDSGSKYAYTYDNANRLLTVDDNGTTGLPQVTLTYAYDNNGNRTSLNDSQGGLTSYTYDVRNELVTVTFSGTGLGAERVDFVYDAAGRMTTLTGYSNLAGSTVVMTSSYAYDAANRVTGITDKNSGGTTQVSYGYTYDAASRVTQETRTWAGGSSADTLTYGYTNNNQLTSVSHTNSSFAGESFSWDANGNQTGTGYTTGSDNEQTASPGYTYTYDAVGNMITATQTSTGDVWTYSYDYRNRMTGAVEKTSGGTVLAQVTYTYDALDNRIGMDENGTQTWTLYDGSSPVMDFTGSGSLAMRYLNGPAGDIVDTVLARQSSGGTVAWYLPDRLGTIRDLINNSGSIIDHVDYSAFGTVLDESSPTNGDRMLGFAGLTRDATTGLNLAVRRVQRPGNGRWTSQDPVGFAAGDANIYRYVGNRPTNFTDKSGLLSAGAQSLVSAYNNMIWDGASNDEVIAALITEALYQADGNNANALALIMEVRGANKGALDNDLWASADHFFNAWNAQDLYRKYLNKNCVSRSLGFVAGGVCNLGYVTFKWLGIPVQQDDPDLPPSGPTSQQLYWGQVGADASFWFPTNMRLGTPEWRKFAAWMEGGD